MKKTLKRNVKNRRTLRRVLKGGATKLTRLMAAMIIQRRLAQELECNKSAPGFFGCKSGCRKNNTYTQIANNRGFYEMEQLPNKIKVCSSNKPLSTDGNIYSIPLKVSPNGFRPYAEQSDELYMESNLRNDNLVTFIRNGYFTENDFVPLVSVYNDGNVELTSEEIAKYQPMAEKFLESIISKHTLDEAERNRKKEEEDRRRWQEIASEIEAKRIEVQKQREAEQKRKYIEEQARLRLRYPELEEQIANRIIEIKSSGV